MKIAVLLSGGVDSAVALKLLADAGHDCTAYYLKIWLEDETSFLGECPWDEDIRFARACCEQFGVPLKIIPLQREYYERIVHYTLDELRAGRTPSPDIFCNEKIKFGAFFDRIEGYERVASGHYARHIGDERGLHLGTAADTVKDQTYFLAHLSEAQLARTLFPLGNLLKHEVRAIAKAAKLPQAERRDSQGICFLGRIKFHDFARAYLGEREGDIIEQRSGKRLGAHKGYWFHTVGQRTGLGLSGGPWFVLSKDVTRNIIYVAHADGYEEELKSEFDVEEPFLINDERGRAMLGCACALRCKLRHGPHFFSCRYEAKAGGGRVTLLDGRDGGCAPGQFTVFYDDAICLGMARIRG
ncbi:MAG: tRNA 2-thiouridine(34) synthase MnmA [Spirochaetota bacterium]|jgi:tRNA-specific 2-thiouridylase|nr:tRNA 2-thiouridine(34) synthase MnmA [Spirochaetota bacterium]